MFVQVVQGSSHDPQAIRQALDRWMGDVVPGSPGYLGSTTGVTEDGTAISVARYESAEAAGAAGSRPEFKQWWRDTAQAFSVPPIVRAADDVFTSLVGNPDEAGFVQVMQGHISDPARARELMERHVDGLNAMRPEILGRMAAQHEGGDYTQVVYFRSEAAARSAESTMSPPPGLMAAMMEMQTLTGRPDYYDLRDPWLTSP